MSKDKPNESCAEVHSEILSLYLDVLSFLHTRRGIYTRSL